MIYTINNKSTQLEWGLSGDDRIVQNVLNLIRTRKFEVPFMRDLGLDPDYIANTNDYIQTYLYDDVIDLVQRYESRATVIEVNLIGVDENGNLEFELKVEV